jgi:hypothetical protein
VAQRRGALKPARVKPGLRTVANRALEAFGLTPKARRDRKTRVLTSAEYWVYTPEADHPDPNEIAKRLYDSNAIDAQEGIVLSDIRLTNVLVLRDKNQRLFRRDLILDAEGFDAPILEAIQACKALVRISYISEEPVESAAYLRLLPHLALATADLSTSPVVYDLSQQRLFTTVAFRSLVSDHKNAADPEVHIRAVWLPPDRNRQAAVATTLGLQKKGLPDLVTDFMESDAELLATVLVREAGATLWNDPSLIYRVPESFETEFFGERFQYSLDHRTAEGKLLVRLFRNRTVS